jgi:hypothetical protein
MLDILFDILAREIVMTGSGDTGDFAVTTNPSVQNGGNLLNSRVAVLTNPMFGTGVNQMIGGNPVVATYEMNRWKTMCMQDGATVAKWTGSVVNGQLQAVWSVSYIP